MNTVVSVFGGGEPWPVNGESIQSEFVFFDEKGRGRRVEVDVGVNSFFFIFRERERHGSRDPEIFPKFRHELFKTILIPLSPIIAHANRQESAEISNTRACKECHRIRHRHRRRRH